MSGQESPGLILNLTPSPAPAGAVWGSLRDVGGFWGLLRYLPGAVRQAFSEREPVGGLPVVEPGQGRPVTLPEIDFGDSYPTADHTPAAEADLSAQVGAEAGTAEAGVSAEATETVVMGEQLGEERLAGHDAGTELHDLTEAQSLVETVPGHEAGLAAEQADLDASPGPYTPGPVHLAQVDDVLGDVASVSASVQAAAAQAELGEAALGEASL